MRSHAGKPTARANGACCLSPRRLPFSKSCHRDVYRRSFARFQNLREQTYGRRLRGRPEFSRGLAVVSFRPLPQFLPPGERPSTIDVAIEFPPTPVATAEVVSGFLVKAGSRAATPETRRSRRRRCRLSPCFPKELRRPVACIDFHLFKFGTSLREMFLLLLLLFYCTCFPWSGKRRGSANTLLATTQRNYKKKRGRKRNKEKEKKGTLTYTRTESSTPILANKRARVYDVRVALWESQTVLQSPYIAEEGLREILFCYLTNVCSAHLKRVYFGAKRARTIEPQPRCSQLRSFNVTVIFAWF